MRRIKSAGRIITDNGQWLLLALGVILSALYARPPLPVDETRYLSVAWEMWQNNEFLVPHLNGLPYSQKPPLFFWVIHLFWWLFGVGEWQARLVAPLFSLFSVGLTVQLARKLWPEDRNVAAISPFILLGMSIWAFFASLTMFDTLLTCCCLIALKLILEVERQRTIIPWIWLSVALGLGLLAKGPVALVYVVPPMLLAPWWSERRGRFWRWWYGCALGALVGAIAIALCWAIPAAIEGGTAYGQDILFGQTASRIVRAFAHQKPFYWYLVFLPLLFFPWIIWWPVWRGWKQLLSDRSSRFCASVILPGLLLLSCISGKQIHYTLPLLPVFALVLAKMAVSGKQTGRFDRLPLVVSFLLAGVACLLITQFSSLARVSGVLHFLPNWLWLIPFLCALPLLHVQTSSPVISAKVMSTSYLLLFMVLHLSIAGPLHAHFQPTEIEEGLRVVQGQARQLAVFPAKLSHQFQFAGHLTAPVLGKNSLDELALWADAHPNEFCLFFTRNPADRLVGGKSLVREYKDGWLIFCSAGDFAASHTVRINPKTD